MISAPDITGFLSGLLGGFLLDFWLLFQVSLSRTGGLKEELSESFGVEDLLGSFAHQNSSPVLPNIPVLSSLGFGGSLRNL